MTKVLPQICFLGLFEGLTSPTSPPQIGLCRWLQQKKEIMRFQLEKLNKKDMSIELDIDIPEDMRSLDKYCATLAHKANHSFLPNTKWGRIKFFVPEEKKIIFDIFPTAEFIIWTLPFAKHY